MKRHLILCGAALSLGLLPHLAFAQQRGGGGGGGGITFGTGGGGGSGGFGTSAGGGGFGQSGGGGFGQSGGGGFGQTGGGGFGQSGGGGFGQSGGGGFGNQQNGGFGQQNGNNSGFLGRNQNSGFLGRNNQQQQGMNGNNPLGGNQFGGGNRQGGGRNNQNILNLLNGGQGGLNTAQGNQAPVPFRPQQKVAFEYPQPQPTVVKSTADARIERLSTNHPGLKGVSIVVNAEGEFVLQGEVKSESDAKLAVNLVRLEPGVRRVRNELTYPGMKSDDE